jgi:hypothetical protein
MNPKVCRPDFYRNFIYLLAQPVAFCLDYMHHSDAGEDAATDWLSRTHF